MGKIQSMSDLEDAIKLLEYKKTEDKQFLREISNMAYDSLKPINIIKNIFKEVVEPQNLKDNLLNTSVGFGAGYLSKLLFQKIVRVPFKNFISNTLMMGVENLISKNPGIISALSSLFLDAISGKSKKNADEEADDEQDNIHREVKTEPIDFETIY